jgi:type 1 glutamine amidotransferase
MWLRGSLLLLLALISIPSLLATPASTPKPAKKKLYLIAGKKSHAYGQHSFRAGCILLKKRLDAAFPDQLETTVIFEGWPKDSSVLNDADAICIYSDGGRGHPANPHLKQLDALAKKGVGIGMMHYAVEVPKDVSGTEFLDWIGGYFEEHWSVNPHWRLRNIELANGHAITRGVKDYATQDEWYYHMRFRDKMEGVTSILASLPPPESLSRPDGPHSGNPAVRAAVNRGEKQTVAWARERADGGRGFGFTGGHFHWTWADDNNRKLVLNALAWISKVDVPKEGVASTTPDIAELKLNHDYPVPNNFDHEKTVKHIVTGGK